MRTLVKTLLILTALLIMGLILTEPLIKALERVDYTHSKVVQI